MRNAPLGSLSVLALALFALVSIALVPVVPAATAQAPNGPPGDRPPCAAARAEARMQAYGFDHIVTVDNQCEAAVSCRVSTDVDPTVIPVSVPARQVRDTVTRRGSPARAFTARVDCDLR